MKKLVAFVLLAALFMGMTIPVSAEESSPSVMSSAEVYLEANSKLEFSQQMDIRYSTDLKAGKIERGSLEEIEKLMMQSTFASGKEKEEINERLEMYGVYEFMPNTNTPTTVPYSGTNDITMQTPTIFYEAWENSWSVTCGGNWNNRNWHVGSLTSNVGDADAFGVGYSNDKRFGVH